MKRFHRAINLSDIDINPWLTTFDYRFYSTDIYDNRFQNSNLAKTDYVWGVHASFISSAFFITSFDTRTILYPELYFKYISQDFNYYKLAFNKIKYFQSKIYINFYINILNLFENYFFNKYKKQFNNLFFIKNVKISKIIQKLNMKCKEKYFIYFILLFNKIFCNDKLLLNNTNNKYQFGLCKIKKKIILKSYFFFRSKKYKNKMSKFINFRLFYLKKVPIANKNSKKVKSFSVIYLKTIYQSIWYKNYYKFFYYRVKKFWDYFFIFFIQNVKKKFCFSHSVLNNVKEFHVDYIFDLLLFIQKFFYFNKYLKKYFNKTNYIKKIKNKKEKKKISI